MNTLSPLALLGIAALSLSMSACPKVEDRAEPCNGNLDCQSDELCLNGYCQPSETGTLSDAGVRADVQLGADVNVVNPDAGPIDVEPRPDVLNEVPFVDSYSASRVAVRVNYEGAPLPDFPLLVRIDKTLPVFEGFEPEQMSVSDENGNAIPFELSEDLENETLIYAKVELSTDLLFFIYFNSPANSLEDPAAVWSDDYVAVFHMEDNEDSAPNSRGAGVYGPVERLRGPLGSALSLSDTDIAFWLGRDVQGIAGASGATACQWTNGGNDGAGVTGFSIGGNNPTTVSRFSVQTVDDSFYTIVRADDQSASTTLESNFTLVGDGTLFWLCSVVDLEAGVIEHYLDDELTDVDTYDFQSATFPDVPSYTAAIGAEDDGVSGFLTGAVDEVIVSRVARSEAYLSAQYAAMMNPFVIFGERETQFVENPEPVGLQFEQPIALEFDEDAVQLIDVLENGSNATRILSVGDAALGNAERTSDHQIAYWPRPNIFGEDSFTFVAGNGFDESESVTVSLSIQSVNDSPVLNNRNLTLAVGEVLDSNLQVSDVDHDRRTLSFEISGQPDQGTLSLDGNTVTYTAGDIPGEYDGFIRVTDPAGGIDVARYRYTVTAVAAP